MHGISVGKIKPAHCTYLAARQNRQHCKRRALGDSQKKALLREKAWFSLMDKPVEQKVKSCLLCHGSTLTVATEPLQMSHHICQ